MPECISEDLRWHLLPTVEGQNIAVSVDGRTVMLNGATILHEDIEAFSVIVIDEVLVPSGYPSATTWDVIVQSPEHTVLEEALAENLTKHFGASRS